MKVSDHVSVQRFGYTHHAIYVGDDSVIHYLKEGIQEDFLEDFSDGYNIHIENSPKKYSEKEIISRAKSRLYENDYNVLWQNCEQFAIWCRTNENCFISI